MPPWLAYPLAPTEPEQRTPTVRLTDEQQAAVDHRVGARVTIDDRTGSIEKVTPIDDQLEVRIQFDEGGSKYAYLPKQKRRVRLL